MKTIEKDVVISELTRRMESVAGSNEAVFRSLASMREFVREYSNAETDKTWLLFMARRRDGRPFGTVPHNPATGEPGNRIMLARLLGVSGLWPDLCAQLLCMTDDGRPYNEITVPLVDILITPLNDPGLSAERIATLNRVLKPPLRRGEWVRRGGGEPIKVLSTGARPRVGVVVDVHHPAGGLDEVRVQAMYSGNLYEFWVDANKLDRIKGPTRCD